MNKKPVINSAVNASLPDTAVEVGKPITIQLAPVGNYPQFVDDPDNEGQQKEVMQILDEKAMDTLVKNFEDERLAAEKEGRKYGVLVDADHSSETSTNTAAMGWVTKLFIDPEKGLMAEIEPTSDGVQKINGKVYRFVSGAWTLDDDGRPEKLVSIGLTNKPNLPVQAMINTAKADGRGEPGDRATNGDAVGTAKKPAASAAADADAAKPKQDQSAGSKKTDADTKTNSNKKGQSEMDIRTKLSLPAEATDEEVEQSLDAVIAKANSFQDVRNALNSAEDGTDEDVINAVVDICNMAKEAEEARNQLAELQETQRNAEAEQLVSENADIIPEEDVEAIKEQYIEDPDATKAAVANMRRVYNRAITNAQKKQVPSAKLVTAINFHAAKRPTVLNMETLLASCNGDPAKENEMLRAMNAH